MRIAWYTTYYNSRRASTGLWKIGTDITEITHSTSGKFPEARALELLRLAKSAAKRLSGKPDDVLASDIIASVIQSWPKYNSQFAFSTWVNRIAERRQQDKVRGQVRRTRRERRRATQTSESGSERVSGDQNGSPRSVDLFLFKGVAIQCVTVH